MTAALLAEASDIIEAFRRACTPLQHSCRLEKSVFGWETIARDENLASLSAHEKLTLAEAAQNLAALLETMVGRHCVETLRIFVSVHPGNPIKPISIGSSLAGRSLSLDTAAAAATLDALSRIPASLLESIDPEGGAGWEVTVKVGKVSRTYTLFVRAKTPMDAADVALRLTLGLECFLRPEEKHSAECKILHIRASFARDDVARLWDKARRDAGLPPSHLLPL